MATIKRQKADGTWEYLQQAGRDVEDLAQKALNADKKVGEFASQLAHTETDIEQRGINISNFERLAVEVSDSPRIQRAINSANGNTLVVPKGNFLITSTLNLPDGFQLIGVSKKNSVLYAETDITIIKNIGAHSITLENLTIKNTFSGTRSNFDVILTNNTNPKINDVEFNFANNVKGNVGILFDKVAGLANEGSTFMPQVVNSWVRNGRIMVDGVTDGKIQGCWIWSHNTDESCIELKNANNWIISNCDLVPSRFAGVLISGTGLSHLTVSECFFDGSYDSIYTGYGVVSTGLMRSFSIVNNKFWNMSEGGMNLTNARGGIISANQFRHNNRADNFFDDIKLNNSSYNTILGNSFIATLPRTNKAYMYNENSTSGDNIFGLNTLEHVGHNYHENLINVRPTTTVGFNKPDTMFDNLKKQTFASTVTSADVDTLFSVGTYYINNGTSAKTPSNRVGFLEVISISGNPNFLLQRFTSFDTPTNMIFYRERENGVWGTWQTISNNLSGTTANRPTFRQQGMCYFDTTINKAVWWVGSGWVDANGVSV